LERSLNYYIFLTLTRKLRDIAHGGANMSKKVLVTGLVTGLLVGAISTILRAKTGVNV